MSTHSKGATRALLRKIPSVERLLEAPEFRQLASQFGRGELLDATRAVLAGIREDVLEGRIDATDFESTVKAIASSVQSHLASTTATSLVPLVNATGIIVHTNLGRAPLSQSAIDALTSIVRGYSNLEFNLADGKRGRREQHAARLLARLFPGYDAHVVNNNAAAVLLILNAFAASREVIISRGELVEIGGSFRIPDILERSGARLREVGTTNKTRLADYEDAIGPSTGLILRVHHSNFRIIGFTERAKTEELVDLGRAHHVPVIEDFGSGNMLPLGPYGLPNEPTVVESLEKGVDLVTFSGDKLLGGPQSGIIVGSPERVQTCRKNPLARALRVDKLTYAALEATLSSYVRESALEDVPVIKMLSTPASEIESRSHHFVKGLEATEGLELRVAKGFSKVGGGAAPEEEIPTYVVTIDPARQSAQQVVDRLRSHNPPIIARISEGKVLIDLRTVLPEQENLIQSALKKL